MAEQTTTEAPVAAPATQQLAEPDPAQRPARLALYLGIGLVVLGALALYLGYNGAATNALPQAQTPYVISGGLAGLGLLALGGVTLAVYVLLRVQGDLRTELKGMREAVETLSDSIAAQTIKSVNGSGPAHNGVAGTVMVARGASSFHRPECRLVTRAEHVRPVAREEVEHAGLTPCRICKP